MVTMTVFIIGPYWKMNKSFSVEAKKNMIELKLCMNGHCILPSKAFYSLVFSDAYFYVDQKSKMAAITGQIEFNKRSYWEKLFKKYLSESVEPFKRNLCLNIPWMVQSSTKFCFLGRHKF